MFETSFFADPKTLMLGVVTGLLFGFLLQRGGVTSYNKILGQFLLKDHTVLKVMLSAIVVGSVGVYAMLGAGLIEGLHVKGTLIWGNLVGGAVFGIGMAVLGYCPGTAIGAAGEGARDAWWGLLGMLVGAAVYAESHDWFSAHLLNRGNLGKTTLAEITGLPPIVLIAGLAILTILIFSLIQKSEKQVSSP